MPWGELGRGGLYSFCLTLLFFSPSLSQLCVVDYVCVVSNVSDKKVL